MATQTLGEVPPGCRQRLLDHYGPSAEPWLQAAPSLLAEAAERWKLSVKGYHDAGHASAIALATTPDGTPVILKAWFERLRYRHEIAALTGWADGPAADVIETADDLSVAALELVGDRPGGAAPPGHERQTVATAIQALHSLGRRRPRPDVPGLAHFCQKVVIPRIRERAQRLDLGAGRKLVAEACEGLPGLREDLTRTTVLHADLYRDNVIFDSGGHPRLIDPHPLVGDAAFDWAFWTVYYDLEREVTDRLATASRISRIPAPEITPWCRALAVDGLLYYLEIDDPALPKIAKVLSTLMTSDVTREEPQDPDASGSAAEMRIGGGAAVATFGAVAHSPEKKEPPHA
ncbi:phosphotransferase [Streptomyces sp. KM273126]|uniref:aminoglycoside phosphotransferase family protein n=1 Tax=Streptomyces sp. KM273126 TaxID=2545247 RepID=UPI00103B8422|nr:aminoglycoside phosphotransferase family protein [Streptomyces sp. KM273126]MBA2806475.1 phosphotransferase [Streptomyces sp. KM273126]